MRIVNENFENINEDDVDLTKGHLVISIAIKEDAEPIDDVTKFAWSDEDYEEVQMYVLNEEQEEPQPSETELRLMAIEEELNALLGV